MPKGYWIANVEVLNPEAYKAYLQANQAVFAKYGARYVVRSGRHEIVEGTAGSRQVVLEFKDYDTALACYRSPEYQAAMLLRTAASLANLVIVEGYEGPQPH